jgi:hypothetical protein
MRMSLRRVARAWIALGVTVAAVLAGTATPAHALSYWIHNDDMEIHGSSTPASRFFFQSANGAFVGRMHNEPPTDSIPIRARSGAYYANITADGDTIYHLAWGSVGKYVHVLPIDSGHVPSCQFSAWAFASNYTFNIEVIDPTTWTYIAVATITHGSTWQYQKLETAAFKPRVADVVLRVSILGTEDFLITANIDDFSLVCNYIG